MKRYLVPMVIISLTISGLVGGCKNPCEDQLDSIRSRVTSFIADSDPFATTPVRCETDQNNPGYDQICDFAERATQHDQWPFYDCTSCDSLEVQLCACFTDEVWVVDDAKQPIYPAFVYCLANYYRIREMCACDPIFEDRNGDCYIRGQEFRPGVKEVCGDLVDQNCDGIEPACDCADADKDGFYDHLCGGNDCDDGRPDVYPGALEEAEAGSTTCDDGIDQDCNGTDLPCSCPDADNDGFYSDDCGGTDCDDTDRNIRPGAADTAGDGIDQNCNGFDLEPECPDADGDGFYSNACGGSDCEDLPLRRQCTTPREPLLKEHNIQQSDICDALVDAFACEFYDADADGVPDQYDGGQDRPELKNREDPECYGNRKPTAAEWNEWFTNPRSLYDGGFIFIDSDGGPDDRDKDGVSNSCDNCEDTKNGFNCLQVTAGIEFPEICDPNGDGLLKVDEIAGLMPDRLADCMDLLNRILPFIKNCDANTDGVATLSELRLGNQNDANGDTIGDACDRDSDGVRNLDDNCPDNPNGFECSEQEFELRCDADLNGIVTGAELATGDQADSDLDGVGDACDNCPNNPNGFDCNNPVFELNCDADGNNLVTVEERQMGNQKDSDGDGIGDACDPD